MPALTGTETRIRVVALTQWPEGYDRRSPEDRKSALFRSHDDASKLDATIEDLDRELTRIGAEGVVLQVDVSGDEIRKSDGLPYSRAEVEPGVVLTFETDEGTHTYPSDLYDHWVDNLRAIFYTLHDLRRIARHGVGTGSEQYRGFLALPGAGETTTTMNVREAAVELARMTEYDADEILEDSALADRVFRKKATWAHPDQGGDTAAWHRLLDARKVVGRHFGSPA